MHQRAIAFFFALCCACAVADALGGENWDPDISTPVCTAAVDQQSPAISSSDAGLLVVWQDSRPDGKKPDTKHPWSVYGRYLQQDKEFPIHVPPDSNAMNPDVSGNNIVWVHNRGWSALLMTTVKDGQPGEIRTIESSASAPCIDGDLVVWASSKNRHDAGEANIAWINDIRAFELDGPGIAFDVTNSAKLPESGPAVSGRTVVWQDLRHSARTSYCSGFLRYRNIDRDAGGLRLAGISDKKAVSPAIDGCSIAWQDDRNGDWDIYGFDTRSHIEREICKGPGDQENPALHGSIVVWQDNRSGDWDIYGYDIRSGETFPVFIGAGNQTEPDVYGDVVVWTDDRDGDKNIYMNQGKRDMDVKR